MPDHPSLSSGRRALVAAASPLARAGLAALLTAHGADVIGQVADDPDLPDQIGIYRPDALIWDLGYDPAGSLDRLAEISAALPVIVLLADDRAAAEFTPALLAHGARAVLLQEAAVTGAAALIAALDAAVHGLIVLHRAAAEAAYPPALYPSAPRTATADGLTPREAEVLRLIAEGLPNKQIAAALGISEHTVKFHVNALLTKLAAQSRTEAVVRATRLGWIAL